MRKDQTAEWEFEEGPDGWSERVRASPDGLGSLEETSGGRAGLRAVPDGGWTPRELDSSLSA